MTPRLHAWLLVAALLVLRPAAAPAAGPVEVRGAAETPAVATSPDRRAPALAEPPALPLPAAGLSGRDERAAGAQAPELVSAPFAEDAAEAAGARDRGRGGLADLSAPGRTDGSAVAPAAEGDGASVAASGRARFDGDRRYWGDTLLDTVNPFSLVLTKVLGVSHARLAPASLFGERGRGAIVGVNAVAYGEPYREASRFMTGEARNGAEVYLTSAQSPDHLVAQLMDAYRERGPIGTLVVAAHGSPGSMSIGGIPMDRRWARSRREYLEKLPRDLFAPGALIVLISCSVAQGYLFYRYGSRVLAEMFGPMLKQGGLIRASTRYVDPELGLIPGRYKSFGERLMRHAIAPLLAVMELLMWLAADFRSKFKKVVEIRIAPKT